MIKKILIANRGEIACRVIKTAQKMGIMTVAVYSEADNLALHVAMADEAVCIGPAPSAESYLVQKNILQAIRDTKADAVHPGYGFLSENASFARALAREKIAFIGPKPRAITAMGDKIESKKLAKKAGVSTVPGYPDAIKNAKEAVKIAKKIGYPVMLKASAGGGGKGMRVAYNDAECLDGFVRATNEAKSSFGDDRVFAEKFIEEPRHIEIQVLGDAHGNVIYLGERECSIQRRHQKVIEEAPSAFLDEDTRQAMGEQAVKLAKAVKYQSAGTVEFIVDKNRNFFFLEMNTRLQVEHPVTELITGLDLVEQMINVAAGKKLTIKQADVKLNGWAMECRVYAEDPFRNFLPSIGRLSRYQAPSAVSDPDCIVRVDTGVYEGGEISMYYDPMIAKLVTWGPDRNAAIASMREALDAYYIRGVSHNIPFLAALMAHQRFIDGNITTNFIAEEYPDGFHAEDVPQSDPLIPVVVAASIHTKKQARAREISGQTRRFEIETNSAWVAVANDTQYPLTISASDHGYDVNHEGSHYSVLLDWQIGQPIVSAVVNGQAVAVQIDASKAGYRTFHRGAETQMQIISPQAAALSRHMIAKIPPDLSRFLLSPMPGLLIRMSAKVGEEVKAGEELAVVEAMKMENSLRAEEDVVIAQVMAHEGDSLTVDQTILEFE